MKQHLLNKNEMQIYCADDNECISLQKNASQKGISQRNVSGNPAQIAAITHDLGPAMCLAGPGSGKTFVLTHHIRYLIQEKHIDPYHILVITFSKASAVEMQNRFFELMEQEYYPVRFGTFHAIFFQILSQYEHYKTSDILTISQKKKYLKTVLLQMNYQGKPDTESMENILSNISYIKNHYYDFETDIHIKKDVDIKKERKIADNTQNTSKVEEIEQNIPQFKEIYKQYENLIRQEHKLDFDDMMLLCHRLLQKRPDILEEYCKEIEYVLIDEYQDINPIQYELVKKIIKPHNNLFVVGDDDQSIYGFRGCNPKIMLNFQRDFPDGKIITFPINYRCMHQIVETAERVIVKNSKRFEKKITAYKKRNFLQEDYKDGLNRRTKGKDSEISSFDTFHEDAVHFEKFENKEKEYEYLIGELKKICRLDLEPVLATGNAYYHQNNNSYMPVKCACLFRTNLDASYFAELLLKEKIPYQMKEKPYNPYEHFISRDFLHYLHIKEGDMRLEEFVPIMNRPLRYISRDAVNTTSLTGRLREKSAFDLGIKMGDVSAGSYSDLNLPAGDFVNTKKIDFQELKKFYSEKEYMLKNIRKLEYDISRMQKMDMFAAINYIRKGIGYDDFLRKYAIEQNASVDEYLKMADEIHKRMGMFSSLEQLEKHIESYCEIPKMSGNYGIQIMTYHASKGLEFDVVFLPDCNEGNIPYKKSTSPEAIEEERRLFYVAMTRAKEKLHILYLDGDQYNRHLVSRFVKDAKGK